MIEALPPWVARLDAELAASEARAAALVTPLTKDQLNWKPAAGSWSVGQCIEHLSVANEVYLAAIERALTPLPPAPTQEIAPGWFGRWFIRNYIAPSDRARKSRAPRIIVPRTPVLEPRILDRYLASLVRIRAFLHRAAPYDVNRIRFRNPFVPLISFTVGTGLEILSKHQQRHLLQAERVLAAMPAP
jgi:hypothetical protein